MKNIRVNVHKKIYPIIWLGIIMVSIYLLVRFGAIFLSDDLGQANVLLKDTAFTKAYCKAMEKGSSVISYAANDKAEYSFPVSIVDSSFVLQKFADNKGAFTARTKEFSSMPAGFTGIDSEGKVNVQTPDKSKGTKKIEVNNAADNSVDAVETMDTGGIRNKLDIYRIKEGILSKEYILTNGKIYNSKDLQLSGNTGTDGTAKGNGQLQVDYARDNTYYEETEDSAVSGDSTASADNASSEAVNSGTVKYSLDQLKDVAFLIHNFYTVDSSTRITESLFDAKALLGKDMTMKQNHEEPQILIYHTHSQEAYADSRAGIEDDTVVGVGSRLTELLEKKYGYNVIHDKTKYDLVDGKEDRSKAYNYAEDGLEKTLKEHPSIEVVIDLHRDSGEARTTMINGKETAKIMLFNGLSMDQNGPIAYLYNPYLQDNLAFSLQVKLKSLDLYPGLFIKNYLKSYRFNMQVRPKCLLIELGTINNTLESAKNAMDPLADVLNTVLQGK